MLVPMLCNYKPQILIRVDITLCFFLFTRARGKTTESFDQPFKYLCYVDNDHKIREKLRKLVTHNLVKLGHEENQQSVLRSVKKHVSLLDI